MQARSYVKKRSLNKKTILWKHKKSSLMRFTIELTERCNNNCLHCGINLPADDLLAKKKELTTIEIKNVLKEATALGSISVRFTGGEPLLRDDFQDLYIFARKLGLKVVLFTNATLITPDIANLFKNIPPLEKIEVTVYGMKKKSYEETTMTRGSFKAAWNGIRILRKNKIPFIVKGALLPSNKHEIDEFEEWTMTIPWMKGSPSYSMFFDLSCRRDIKKNQRIKKVRLSPQEGLKVLTRRKDEYIKNMQEFCSKFVSPRGDKMFSCDVKMNTVSIDAYGFAQMCLPLRHPSMVYNLKNGSLKDAVDNFFPKLLKTKVTNPEYMFRCAKCFLGGICKQCPGKSWREHGTLDTPVEYVCEVAHTQAVYLGLLEKDEKAWKVKNGEQRIRNFLRKLF